MRKAIHPNRWNESRGAAKYKPLVHRVIPEDPSVARAGHLQGTVRIHAIIGKDGGIRSLRVMRGACSLAKTAVGAVGQWRYRPTTIQGNPVEVDTTIDAIFALNY